MGKTMTLERVRDWHATCAVTYERSGESALADQHRNLAAAITAHLAQPAQAVDVGAAAKRLGEYLREIAVCISDEALQTAVTRALSVQKAGPVGDGWQPIETAPKDGTTIIVGRDMGDFGFVRGHAHWEGMPGSFVSGWMSCGFTDPHGNLGLGHPTHWCPIPASPTPGKEGEG